MDQNRNPRLDGDHSFIYVGVVVHLSHKVCQSKANCDSSVEFEQTPWTLFSYLAHNATLATLLRNNTRSTYCPERRLLSREEISAWLYQVQEEYFKSRKRARWARSGPVGARSCRRSYNAFTFLIQGPVSDVLCKSCCFRRSV